MFSWAKILVALAVVSAVTGGYVYVRSLNNTIETLSTKNATLEISLDVSEEAVKFLQQDQARRDEQLQVLYGQLSTIRNQNRELNSKINKIDLSTIAKQEPEIVKEAVNKATSDANRCFELISGSPLNEREQNAKTAQEFNPECTWLFPAR